MKTKQELLQDISAGLSDGIITENDLRVFLAPAVTIGSSSDAAMQYSGKKAEKLSAVDIMFYIAGIVLFSAIISVIAQSWNSGNALLHIFLSAGVGAGLWTIAYRLLASQEQNEVRSGLINALLLTGSLTVVTGGYIITNELIGGFDEVNYIPSAIMLAIVGAIHIWFDRLVKRNLLLQMGVLLGVLSFPAFLFGLLQYVEVPVDVWAIIVLISAGLLAYATRVVAQMTPDRPKIRGSFDWIAAFIVLATMYLTSFTEYGIIWLMALIGGIFGIFYLSIVNQNKHLLGSASFFMVLTDITISFRYFSGFGVTTSLVLATIGLLGSAAVASNINKKYFTTSSIESDPKFDNTEN